MQLIDSHGRRLDYLRISVTDRCNLRCLYCMLDGNPANFGPDAVLTYEELFRLVRIAVQLGVTKVRLTGGEPLVRRSLTEFIARLTALEGLRDVSLTTNGVYLRDNLEKLRKSGLRRINISLDTLRRERFRRLTGSDCFGQVWEGIRLAGELGFHPVKINMVVIKGINDDEVSEMAKLSLRHPFQIRFIEYMPVGLGGRRALLHSLPPSVIRARLRHLGELVPIPKGEFDGPAQRFRLAGAPGEIGFISPMSQHFCESCNRLRLTAGGSLMPCLLSEVREDIKGPMRRGATDRELAGIFLKAALGKNGEHCLTPENQGLPSSKMHAIGG
jgi:GTP 3',8-cyclase